MDPIEIELRQGPDRRLRVIVDVKDSLTSTGGGDAKARDGGRVYLIDRPVLESEATLISFFREISRGHASGSTLDAITIEPDDLRLLELLEVDDPELPIVAEISED